MKISLRSRTRSRGAELRVEVGLERVEARGDRFGGRKFRGDGVGGLQTVPGDADNSGFLWLDAILRDACGDAARGFREDTFGFREQLDSVHDLRIGNIFGPAAGFTDQLDGVRPVGRIANGERTRDGIWFLRLEALEVALHAI